MDMVHDADRRNGDLALIAELHRLAGAPFADRAGVGVVQADQPGRAFGCLPGQPGSAGLDHRRNLLKGVGVAISGPWAGQG